MNSLRIIPGVILIVIGITSLLRVNLLDYVWPMILIFLGWRMLVKNQSYKEETMPIISEEGDLNEVRIFSRINKKVTNKNFRGGNMVVIFGDGELDLSEAESEKKKLKLEIVVIFGNLRVRVPRNWDVKTEGVGIVGNFDNKTGEARDNDTALLISGAAIFGGLESVSNFDM